MNVFDLYENEVGKIKIILCTSELKDFDRFYYRQGLLPGEQIRMIKKLRNSGPVIIEIQGHQFALSKEEAKMILLH